MIWGETPTIFRNSQMDTFDQQVFQQHPRIVTLEGNVRPGHVASFSTITIQLQLGQLEMSGSWCLVPLKDEPQIQLQIG